MPNYCNYSMKVVASDEENLKKFIFPMQNTYHYVTKSENDSNEDYSDATLKFEDETTILYTNADKHFYHVFEAEDEDIEQDDNVFYTHIYGDCAWLVSSCM